MKRDSCVFCAGKLKELVRVPKMPVFMGTVPSKVKYQYEDLIYAECLSCGTVQLAELVDPKILYASNHNIEIVGPTWASHNERFAAFVEEYAELGHILEIGDPAAKIARLLPKAKKWEIVEPNIADVVVPQNVSFVKGWLGKAKLPKKVDAVVLSHVFEHFHNPGEALALLRASLRPNGRLILSIPDMWVNVEDEDLPPAGMHFEHTFYIELAILTAFLNNCGLKPIKVSYFWGHSIFIAAEKQDGLEPDLMTKVSVGKVVKNQLSELAKEMKSIKEKDFYLYGAHFPAQLLLGLGLDIKAVKGILDNSSAKINNILYGTGLKVSSPQVLKNETSPVVMCRMGHYTDEIKKGIKAINPNARFI